MRWTPRRRRALRTRSGYRRGSSSCRHGRATVDAHLDHVFDYLRAALVADEIARSTTEFFSFGTNDLTQTTLGMSRDDSGSFIPAYTELDIIDSNPFATIDQKGVGRFDGNHARSRSQNAAQH